MAKDLKGKELPPGIRQRKNGRYEGRVQYKGERYSVYADTIAEVKKEMTAARYKLEHGEFIVKSNITVNDWFETWIEQYKKNQVKRGTIIAYTKTYDMMIRPQIGSRKLIEIRGEHIQKLYNDAVKQEFSHASIRLMAAILNGCFKQAMKNRLIERNPVTYATLPKNREEKHQRVLTKEEQEIFLRYAKEHSYLYNLFALDIRTGMRYGEICGLKYSDVDKAAGVIHVRRTIKYIAKQGYFEDTPKTRTSARDIPLTTDMLEIVEAQKRMYETRKVVKLDSYIFRTVNDTPINREAMQHEIDKIITLMSDDGIKIDRFTPHCFRHTFATRAIENGMKPQTLKAILGHANLAMTMDLYSHVLPNTKAEEMEMIAKAF